MKVDEIIGVQEDLSAKIGVTIYVGMRPETYGYPADWPAEEKAACQKKVALRLKLYLKKDEGSVPAVADCSGFVSSLIRPLFSCSFARRWLARRAT